MDIVCFGVLIMDMFPTEQGKGLVDQPAFRPAPGGAPANVAVAAARLGAKSAFIGKVGDDIFGRHLCNVVKNNGVNTGGVRFDSKARTTMNFHAKPERDKIEYLFYRNPGADTTITEEELDRELIASAKAFHFDSLCLTDQPCRGTTLTAVEIARRAGAVISFDINYRPAVWKYPEDMVSRVLPMLGRIDILKLNEDEIRLMCGDVPVEAAVHSLLKEGPQLCVVTLGPKGSYFGTKAGGGFIPALDVEVVDAVGCGDAFIAGLLVKIAAGGTPPGDMTMEMLDSCMRYADTVAALTATRYGAMPALPAADEVEAALKQREMQK